MRRNSSSFNITVILLYTAIEITLFGLAAMKLHQDNITLMMYDIFCIVSMFVILFTLCDFIIRLCKILEENEECDTMQSLKSSFEYNTIVLLAIAVCGTFLIMQIVNGRFSIDHTWRSNSIACVSLCCFVFIPFMALTVSQQKLNADVSFINGLDYGTGMAYSYYYGYLKIVLPSMGTTNKGILEKIENFEDKHNVSFTIKKLFILIPSSTYVPPDLKEVSYGWMESSQQLEPEIRDRAGIKRRFYHNNIYKIYPGGKRLGIKPEYVAVEGATPMLTLFEVQKHFHKESATYRKYRRQIIKLFYTKLQELVYNDPDCKDLCDLIYYYDHDQNGTKVNVAKILLKRIEENEY